MRPLAPPMRISLIPTLRLFHRQPILTCSQILLRPAIVLPFKSHHHHHNYHQLQRSFSSSNNDKNNNHTSPLSPSSSSSTSSPQSPKIYTYDSLLPFTTSPSPSKVLLIDVREPSELRATGRIPGALSLPLTSNPDAFHLSAEDFEDRFGFQKPAISTPSPSPTSTPQKDERESNGDNGDGVVEEVIFYCKAGVRSRAAARLAGREWGGGEGGKGKRGLKIGDFSGGWMDWERNGGASER